MLGDCVEIVGVQTLMGLSVRDMSGRYVTRRLVGPSRALPMAGVLALMEVGVVDREGSLSLAEAKVCPSGGGAFPRS